jgi:outer membrane protein assembly factor BamE (lipoprotein component of BamABCDE complex)
MRVAKPAHLLAGLLLAALAGCSVPTFMSYPPQVRGNDVDDTVLAQLVPGTSTRADVTALIGSPTTRDSFDDNIWIYIGQVTRPKIGATNTVLDQKVLALSFDQQGVLRDITRKGSKDAVDVAMVSRTTPAPGTEASFISQLLGNIGKFSPTPVDSSGTSSIQQSGRPGAGNF